MGFAIAGGAVLAAGIAANASSNAASAETNAANNASDIQRNQNNLSRQDMQPWLDSGKAALSTLNSQMPNLTRNFSQADFQNDPGYQFNLQQGQQAIERSAAARGGLNSGATMKSLAGYTSGLASNDYQNAYNRFTNNQTSTYNRLAGLAGVGQTAAANNSANGLSTANSIGNNITAAGNAQAAGQIATGNNITSLVGNGMNTWMSNQMLNRLAPQNPNGGGGGGGPSYMSPY